VHHGHGELFPPSLTFARQVAGENFSDQGTMLLIKDNLAFVQSVKLWGDVCWLPEDPLIKTLSTGGYINTKPEDGGESSSQVRPLLAGVLPFGRGGFFF